MDDPEKKVPTFYIHNNLLDSGPHKGSKQSLLGTACPNRPSLGPPQRAYTLDSSLRNCFQHLPVTPIPITSSPSPGWYQTAASPSKGKNRGRGRQKNARWGKSTEEDSERTLRLRVVYPWCQPSHQEYKLALPHPEVTPLTGRTDRGLQQQPRHLCRTQSPRPRKGRGRPVPPAAAPVLASLPSRSTVPSDRSRGRRPQTHAVQDSWCNRAQTPSSRRRGAGRTFRTVTGEGGTASRPGPSPWPTPGGGGTYCGGCGLAPSGWRRRISRPSRSTPGAGTEPPSARRRSPAISPRVRPPPTRSPPRWCPRSRGRCYCRRCRCRHCALPASPAARMRSVTPRSPGCGRAGPEAGEARRGRAGGWQPGDRGEVGRVHAAEFPWLWLATAGWRPARWDSFLAASRLIQRGGGMTGPTSAAALGSAVAAQSAQALQSLRQLLRAAGLLL